MPYVNVRVAKTGVTAAQKAEIIKGITDVLVKTLGKDPERTFVVIDEVDLENWGIGGESIAAQRAKGK
jgi:4-oxalocrotonate tautomerase